MKANERVKVTVERIKELAEQLSHRFDNDAEETLYDELLSEGFLGLSVAAKIEDIENIEVAGWVWRTIKHEMFNYINSRHIIQREVHLEDIIDDPFELRSHMLNPEEALLLKEHNIEFPDKLMTLSEEAKQVCRMVFESPEEFFSNAPKMARGVIFRKLREFGWKWEQIWSSFTEIKKFLNENAN